MSNCDLIAQLLSLVYDLRDFAAAPANESVETIQQYTDRIDDLEARCLEACRERKGGDNEAVL